MHLGLDASTIKCLSSMREALWTSPYCNEKKICFISTWHTFQTTVKFMGATVTLEMEGTTALSFTI